MNYKFIFGLFLIALFVFSISAPAHHGTNISYDHSKTVVFKAIVTEFRYSRFSSGAFREIWIDGRKVPADPDTLRW